MTHAANVTSTGTLVAAGPVTIVEVYYAAGAAAGSIVLRDGGASGAVKFTLQTPASAGAAGALNLKAGILFGTDVHATLTEAVGVTVVYQQ